MNKAQKIMLGFLAVSLMVIIAIFLYYLVANGRINPNLPQNLTFYYGYNCPHCKIVEEFMTANNVTSKINITQREIYLDKTNKAEFLEVIKICKIDINNAGVPTLYVDGKCYEGDQPIINFFKSQLNL